MGLENLLLEHGKKHGLGKLILDENNICRLLVNDSLLVSLEKSLDGKGFFLYATIGSIPAGREKEVALEALDGNLFGKETGYARIGYDSTSNNLVLFQYFEEATTDYPIFSEKFEEFAQYMVYWLHKLEIAEAPPETELSLKKHVLDLQEHKKMQIFFA